MVPGVNNTNNIQQSTFQPQIIQNQQSTTDNFESLNSFADEDKAIISSQAKLQYELEKFNSGADNLVELAAANVMAKFTVNAEVNIINTKKSMMDAILEICE